ncbi:hypothetical protein CAEBREN_15957 [Caenorhabditis brenneri]|uniref:Uncharacterized protein n=1 Tax=Caenorhabditis brenneri TaxID=135651 RepID=G0NVB8_CAEBE|nr:hypothetical protein CAEBREN_15957 [Caenorhabditis brenneri]
MSSSSIKTLTKIAKVTANIKNHNDVESSLLKLKEMDFPFHLVKVCNLEMVVRQIPNDEKFEPLKDEVLKKFKEMEEADKENKKEETKKSSKKRQAEPSTSGAPPAKRKPAVKDQKTARRAPPPPVVNSALKEFKIPKKSSPVAASPKETPMVTGPIPLMSLNVQKPAWL